jgi:hypothetical protein
MEASITARFTETVVLPTPPLPLAIPIIWVDALLDIVQPSGHYFSGKRILVSA